MKGCTPPTTTTTNERFEVLFQELLQSYKFQNLVHSSWDMHILPLIFVQFIQLPVLDVGLDWF